MSVENLSMDTVNILTSVILNTIRPFALIKTVFCLTVKKDILEPVGTTKYI